MNPSNSPAKILIVDDHQLFTDGLKLILSGLDQPVDITTRYSAEDVVHQIDQLADYDLLLCDLQMPGFSGFGLLEAIHSQKIAVRVLVISGTEDRVEISRVMALGAHGFIPKSMPSEEIINGIQAVLQGKHFLPEKFVGQIDWNMRPEQDPANGLSADVDTLRPRQLEVLRLMHKGHTNSQIAAILGVSESAIKSHISILFKALRVKNRTSCVQAGLERQLIQG